MFIKTTNTIATMNGPYTKSCFKHGSRRHLIANYFPYFKSTTITNRTTRTSRNPFTRRKGKILPIFPTSGSNSGSRRASSGPWPPENIRQGYRNLLWTVWQCSNPNLNKLPNYIIIFFLNHYTLKSELPWWLHWLHLQCHNWQSNASYSDTSSRRFSSHISTSRNLKPVLWFWLLLLHYLSAWNRLCPNHTTWMNGSSGSNYKTNSALAVTSTPTVSLRSKIKIK